MSKTIKIPDNVHKELKRYIADNSNQTMEDTAGYSIMSFLKEIGHKFIKPASKKKPADPEPTFKRWPERDY